MRKELYQDKTANIPNFLPVRPVFLTCINYGYTVTRNSGRVHEISVFFDRFLLVRFHVKPETSRKRSTVAVFYRKLPSVPQIRSNLKRKTRNFWYSTRLSGSRTPIVLI